MERTAMVTGAGSGVGRAVVERLLGRDYTVFGSAISDKEAHDLTQAMGGGFVPIRVDVRDEVSVARAADEVGAHLDGRPLNALLNIAGVIDNGPLVDLPADKFTNMLAVNVVGMHAMTRAFVPLLSRHQRPRVVNMGSTSGVRALPFAGAYAATKYAVEGLSTAMNMELAPLGIAVVVIGPGLMQTPMTSKIRQDLSRPPSLAVYEEPLRRCLAQVDAALANDAGVPVSRVVDAIVAAVADPDPPLRRAIPEGGRRAALRARLRSERRRQAIVRQGLGLDR